VLLHSVVLCSISACFVARIARASAFLLFMRLSSAFGLHAQAVALFNPFCCPFLCGHLGVSAQSQVAANTVAQICSRGLAARAACMAFRLCLCSLAANAYALCIGGSLCLLTAACADVGLCTCFDHCFDHA